GRRRRWPDLGRFRAVLLPFVPGALRLPGLALRVSAFFADALVLLAAYVVLLAVYAAPEGPGGVLVRMSNPSLAVVLGEGLALVAYFGVLEGLWGASLGKRLTGLRVSRVGAGGPPGPAAAALRAAVFFALTGLPDDLTSALIYGLLPPPHALLFEPLSLA